MFYQYSSRLLHWHLYNCLISNINLLKSIMYISVWNLFSSYLVFIALHNSIHSAWQEPNDFWIKKIVGHIMQSSHHSFKIEKNRICGDIKSWYILVQYQINWYVLEIKVVKLLVVICPDISVMKLFFSFRVCHSYHHSIKRKHFYVEAGILWENYFHTIADDALPHCKARTSPAMPFTL